MKDKVIKSTLSIILAIAFLILTPGISVFAFETGVEVNGSPLEEESRAANSKNGDIIGIDPLMPPTEKTFYELLEEKLSSGEAERVEYADESKKAAARIDVASKRIQQLRSGNAAYPSTKGYLKQEYPLFSSDISKSSNVSLSSGTLNVGYVLATLNVRGGMAVNLQLIYDSSDSNTKTKTWDDDTTVEYYAVTGDVYRVVDINTGTYEDTFSNIEEHYFQTESALENFLATKDELDHPDYVSGDENHSYEWYFDRVIETSMNLYPENFVSYSTLSPAQAGLAPGWRFNIPNIEVLTSKIDDDDDVNTSSYLVLTLDTGESYRICDLEFENHPINDIMIELDNSVLYSKQSKYLVTKKDGTKYYFDEHGYIIRKEDRYGNALRYEFSQSGMISSISDETNRAITVTVSSNVVTVSTTGGVENTITLSSNALYENRSVSSVSFGTDETYSFTYTANTSDYTYTENSVVNTDTWILLVGITAPNGDQSKFSYQLKNAGWGYGEAEYYVVSSKWYVINNETKNTTTYSYTGTAKDAYYYRVLRERYNIGALYTFTVTENFSSGYNTYIYDENLCLLSVNSYVGGTCVESELYEYDSNLMMIKSTKESTSEYGVELYEYDQKGNLTAFYDKQSNGVKTALHKTTYSYNGTYSICTSKTYYQDSSTFITEQNTLTNGSRSIASSIKKVGNTTVASVSYEYDSYGNVTKETTSVFPGSSSIEKTYTYYLGTYLASETVKGMKDADGQSLSNITASKTYSDDGRVLSETNALGYTTAYTYNLNGKLSTITYPNNATETYSYDPSAGTVTHKDLHNNVTINTYNGLGDIVSVKDNSTNTVIQSVEYDNKSRVYREYTCQSVTPYSYAEYTYDGLGRLTSESLKSSSDAIITQKTYAYDPLTHTVTETTVGDTNAPSIVKATVYDAMGRETSVTIGTSETTYTYDFLGNVLTETNPAGYVTATSYSPLTRQITVTNALNASVVTTYDSLGRTLTVTDASGATTTYTYDNMGRTLTVSTPVESGTTALTKTYYDAAGNVTKKLVQNDTSSFSRTENTYDNMGNLTQTAMYDGNTAALTTSYTYNAAGDILTQTTGGAIIIYTYDRFGNNTSITDALGNTETRTYNLNCDLVSSTDRNGIVTTYTYLVPGVVSSATATKGSLTSTKTYLYTATGALRSTTCDGVTLTYSYDARGNVLTETEYDGTDTILSSYTYDARDLRTKYDLYRGGTKISEQYYEYNALGQLVYSGDRDDGWDEVFTQQVWVTQYVVGPSASDANKVYWNDVDVGSYTASNSSNSSTKLCINGSYYLFSGIDDVYGGSGTVSLTGSISTTTGGTLYYGNTTVPITMFTEEPMQYDPIYIMDSSGAVWFTLLMHPMLYYGYLYVGNYGFEYPSHPEQVLVTQTYTVHHDTGNIHKTAQYTYDARGNVLTEIKDNSTKTIFTYTTGGLVLTKKNYKNSTVQSSFAYTYYPNGNVKTETTKSGKVTTYQYDDLGRLVSEAVTGTSNNYTITYTYDARGNRATKTIGNSTVTYTYDLNNRLTQSTENGITLYTYDNNGNTLTVINGTNTATYTYDLWNRQKSYTPDGILTTQTTYRPDGMRHSIGTTKHIWDGGNIVGDYAGTSYTKYFRTYWLIFTETGTTKKYYNSNGHGDIIALTNTSGTVTKNYEYNAFGEETNPVSTDTNPFRYCGEYFDKVSGTLYLRARNYNASIGRFTQQDGWEYEDIYNPLTLNLYTYCWNTPINGLDPSGHSFFSFICQVATFFVEDIIMPFLDSFEIEIGVGYGVGVSAEVGPVVAKAEAYNDNFTIKLDDSELSIGSSGSAEIGIYDPNEASGFAIGSSFYHDYGDLGVKCPEHNMWSDPFSMADCELAEKEEVSVSIPFAENGELTASKDISVGVAASVHFIVGFHFSLKFNFSQFIRNLEK